MAIADVDSSLDLKTPKVMANENPSGNVIALLEEFRRTHQGLRNTNIHRHGTQHAGAIEYTRTDE
jgi:hypothetical protein